MSDEIFGDDFKPDPVPAAGAPAAKQNGRKRNRRAARPAASATPPATKPPVTRKRGRPAAAKPAEVREIKLGLAAALQVTAGMRPEDVGLFGQMAAALNKVSKGARSRIVLALGKLFG